MNFFGRKKSCLGIIKALEQSRNIVVTGKFGIGKTTLVRRTAEINRERWRFLFADFSTTPARVCQDLLAELRPKRPSGGHKRYVDYKHARSLIVDLASKDNQRCVMVLDNIEKLTPQKLGLIRYLARDEQFLFIAIAERFLSEDDLFHLRACLYPSKLIRLPHLSAKQTAGFFRYYKDKHQFRWTESDIHMLTLATKGYPMAMRESVARELERQKGI